MGFKMKGSPATAGGIQGTSSHSSALKMKQDDIDKLLEKRRKLKEIKKRREDKGKNTNRIDRRIERNQDKINVDPDAIDWKNEKKKEKITPRYKDEKEDEKVIEDKDGKVKKKKRYFGKDYKELPVEDQREGTEILPLKDPPIGRKRRR